MDGEELRSRLREIVVDSSVILKGGLLIDARQAGQIRIIELYETMPSERVVHIAAEISADIVGVGVYAQRAEEYRSDLIDVLSKLLQVDGVMRSMTYLELADALEIDDEMALRLMALGTHMKLWTVQRFRASELLAASLVAISTIDPSLPVLASLFA